MIKIKVAFLTYFSCCCFITSFSQVNDFVKSLNKTVFSSASTNGWVKFAVNIPFTEENIFTDGKKYFLLEGRFSMKLFKSKKDVNNNGTYKFKEFFKEIEIEDALYILHTKNGKLESGNGYIYTPAFINEQKNISEASALQFAIKDMKPADLFWNIAAKEQAIKKKERNSHILSQSRNAVFVVCQSTDLNTLLPFFYINTFTG